MKKNGKYLMQFAIVCMGFSMNPQGVISAGREGLLVTLITLLISMSVGFLLGRWLKVEGTVGTLISAGTGICGGSAIASLSPILNSKKDEIAISMACVFFLNAVALLLFPWLGKLLQLTPEQFGWFAAIAIHDTSSVVGAATEFSKESVEIAVTAKLTRALWIIPMMIVAMIVVNYKAKGKDSHAGQSRFQIPWFIFIFIGAVTLHMILPPMASAYQMSDWLGKSCMKIAIFITGAQLTRAVVAAVGPKAMTMAIILWLTMTGVTYFWVI